jgi:alpha-L-fucosidase
LVGAVGCADGASPQLPTVSRDAASDLGRPDRFVGDASTSVNPDANARDEGVRIPEASADRTVMVEAGNFEAGTLEGGRGTDGADVGDVRAAGGEADHPRTLSELQDDFMKLKFGMFLHFNMGTFTGEEWATPHGDPTRFNPVGVDANQWAETAVAAGVKYVVLTTKHHDGFCLWNSAYTDYDVGSSPWKGGKGDLVREYVDAMRAHGLAVGFYFSIWDRTNGDNDGLPTIAFVKNQLTELLTQYGPVSLLWFDGWGWEPAVTYARIPYETIREHIRSLQPNLLVLENNHEHTLVHSDVVGYERNVEGTPPANNMLPAEVADNIRSDGKWFFSNGSCNLKPLATLNASLIAVGMSHANYLLDLTPNQQGQIPDCQVKLIAMLKR